MENLKKQTPLVTSNQGTLVFRHKCSAGDTTVNFNALVWTSTEIAAYGLANPPSWVITSSNLASLKSQCLITSSRGYDITPEYFNLFNSSLSFKNYVASEGEILTFRVSNTSRQAYDLEVQPINRQGTLTAGTKTIDFVDVVSVPTLAERCPITVKVGGAERYYPDDFSFVGLSSDASKTRSITLTDALNEDVDWQVVGIAAYNPNSSLLPQVETLNGTMAKVVSDLVQLTNKDAVDYNATPNSVDLAYFANTMNALLNTQVTIARQTVWNAAWASGQYALTGSGMFYMLSYTAGPSQVGTDLTVTNDATNGLKFVVGAGSSGIFRMIANLGTQNTAAAYAIYKNGVLVPGSTFASFLYGGTASLSAAGGFAIKLNEGDYIQLYKQGGALYETNVCDKFMTVTFDTVISKTLKQLAGL